MKNILFLQKVYKSTFSKEAISPLIKSYNLNELIEELSKKDLKDLTYDGDTKDWYQYKDGIWQATAEHEIKKLLWKTLAKDSILVNKLNPEYLKKVMDSFAILNSKSLHQNCPRQHKSTI